MLWEPSLSFPGSSASNGNESFPYRDSDYMTVKGHHMSFTLAYAKLDIYACSMSESTT